MVVVTYLVFSIHLPRPVLAAPSDVSTGWTLFGFAGAAVVLIGLAIQWGASRSAASRRRPSTTAILVGTVGAILLGVYALATREWVFVAAQLIVVLFGIQLLTQAPHGSAMGQAPPPAEETPSDEPRLPQVKPDSAERIPPPRH